LEQFLGGDGLIRQMEETVSLKRQRKLFEIVSFTCEWINGCRKEVEGDFD
jgi:hypothetical protein